MKNKTISKKTVVTAAILLAAVFALPVYAEGTGGRRGALKSEGIIEYTDGEHRVLIDSRDIYYLADEIDNLETAAKLGTLQAIQALPDAAASAGLAGKNAADIPSITFADLNGAIRASQQSASAPTAAEILSGKVTWANGRKITGTMRNNGATGASNLNAGGSYTIPAGYTTGGTVTTASLASQTAATATAANISSGKKAWVNGQLITGTGADNDAFYEQGRTAGYEQGYTAGYEQGKEESIGLEIIFIGNLHSEGSFDIKPFYSDYASLTTPNFALSDIEATKDGAQGQNNSSNASILMSYDAATGILTVSRNIGGDGGGHSILIEGKVYLYAPKQ